MRLGSSSWSGYGRSLPTLASFRRQRPWPLPSPQTTGQRPLKIPARGFNRSAMPGPARGASPPRKLHPVDPQIETLEPAVHGFGIWIYSRYPRVPKCRIEGVSCPSQCGQRHALPSITSSCGQLTLRRPKRDGAGFSPRLAGAARTRPRGRTWTHPDGTYIVLEQSPDVKVAYNRLRAGLNHLAVNCPDADALDVMRRAGQRSRVARTVRGPVPARRRAFTSRAVPGEHLRFFEVEIIALGAARLPPERPHPAATGCAAAIRNCRGPMGEAPASRRTRCVIPPRLEHWCRDECPDR